MKLFFSTLLLAFGCALHAQPNFDDFKTLSNSLQVELFAPEKAADIFRVAIVKGANGEDMLVNSDTAQGAIVYMNVFYKDNPEEDHFAFSLHKPATPEYTQKLTSKENRIVAGLGALTDYIKGCLNQKLSDRTDKIDYVEIYLALPHLTEVFSDNGVFCFTNKVKLSPKLLAEMLIARPANAETAPDPESSQTDAEKTE